MRNLNDFKQHLAQVLGLKFDENDLQTVESVIEDVTKDYSEAQDYLAKFGEYGENGVYVLSKNQKDADYWKNRYMNSYLGRREESGLVEDSADGTDVTPMEDEEPTTMTIDQIIGKESV